MDANVQESTAKAEKLNIDSKSPKFSTNWCDIPKELRSECIQRMGFETRMSLRRTSKTEKSLVESAKCHLEHLTLNFGEFTQSLTTSDENSVDIYRRECSGNDRDMFRSALSILEHCEIDTFTFRTEPRTEYCLVEIFGDFSKNSPFRFKTFKSDTTTFSLTSFFLKNCEGVENVLLESYCMGNRAVKVIDFPSVINAKLFQFMYLPEDLPKIDRSLFQLVQKWIDKDADVGKELRFAFDEEREDEPTDVFASIFKDRVISEDDETVRIRTDNPSKHVILRCDKVCSDGTTFFSCSIIPSNLLELTDNSGWVDELYSDYSDDEDEDEEEEREKVVELSIDSKTPKYSTNWCDIPMEMRLECVKRMDFVTRMRLRRTSKTEKSLVELKKHYLKHLELKFVTVGLLVRAPGHIWKVRLASLFENNYRRSMIWLIYMLTHHELDTFEFCTYPTDESRLEWMFDGLTLDSQLCPFRFKTFRSESNSSLIQNFFLKHCKGVENIFLTTDRRGNDAINELINFPSVINAELFQCVYLYMGDELFELVQKWIDNDAEIGKKLRFGWSVEGEEDETIQQFAMMFKDRVISKDEGKVRIRTENDSKHIILKEDNSFGLAVYFTCTIIPSILPDFREDWEWAGEIHEAEFGEPKEILPIDWIPNDWFDSSDYFDDGDND